MSYSVSSKNWLVRVVLDSDSRTNLSECTGNTKITYIYIYITKERVKFGDLRNSL